VTQTLQTSSYHDEIRHLCAKLAPLSDSRADSLRAALTERPTVGDARALTIEDMPGGASTRKYFRVHGAQTALVAMFVPEGAKAEEIDKAGAGQRWPFLEVRDLLEARGIRVPRVLLEDTDRGWLFLEDLGDDTLANYLLKYPNEKERLYVLAVRRLAAAQRDLRSLPDGCVVARRSFDVDLLRWEIDHFREWGIDARGLRFSDADAQRFAALGEELAQRIARFPQGFVHRDYQSRNLMVQGDDLVWIDFQDALLGPRAYDLVALLGDSYQEFDRAFIEARLDDYAAELGLGTQEREALGLEFDLITVQRKLKDAGRFVFIDRVKGNPSFLKFVSPTIKKVAAALERLRADASMCELRDILRRTLGDEFS
jgi:hypothetical protein